MDKPSRVDPAALIIKSQTWLFPGNWSMKSRNQLLTLDLQIDMAKKFEDLRMIVRPV